MPNPKGKEIKMSIFRMIGTAFLLAMTAGAAFAQAPDYLSQNRAAARAAYARQPSNGVDANDRCGGVICSFALAETSGAAAVPMPFAFVVAAKRSRCV